MDILGGSRPLSHETARIRMLGHRKDWLTTARPNQLPPKDDNWDIWLALAGRGFGKTRLGAEAIGWDTWAHQETISHVIAATHGDLRSVCYEGESGLLNIIPPECLKTNGYNRSLAEIHLTNGSIIRGFSAEAPDRARGPQCHRLWGDEVAAWDVNRGNAQAMFDMAMLGLRLGQRSYAILTTTPKPIMLIKNLVNLALGNVTDSNKLLKDLRIKLTRGSTQDNFNNLSKNFQIIISQYKGTRLGRQELDAEILADIQGALWNHEIIDALRRTEKDIPDLVRIVVAIDPAASTNENSDETGIVVAGVDADGEGWVLQDASGKYKPEEWATEAVSLYRKWDADAIVAEVNNGGDMVGSTIRSMNANVPFKAVRASRGKAMRAEPISALYEQGKVHHVGQFPKLEDQLCSLTVDFDRRKNNYSPDRADALVWAITELMLGDMDAMGIYEYYRKNATDLNLKNSTFKQKLGRAGYVFMRVGPSCSSTVYLRDGSKVDAEDGFIFVPQDHINIFRPHGFELVEAQNG